MVGKKKGRSKYENQRPKVIARLRVTDGDKR